MGTALADAAGVLEYKAVDERARGSKCALLLPVYFI